MTVHTWHFVVVALAGWINREKQQVVDYLEEERPPENAPPTPSPPSVHPKIAQEIAQDRTVQEWSHF